MIRVKRLVSHAVPPQRQSVGAAGYDLYAAESVIIPPSETGDDETVHIGTALVSTGIVMEIPAGFVGRIAPRSGLSVKHHIETGAGVIDHDYRGEIFVKLINFGHRRVLINAGERIAQILIQPICQESIEVVDELTTTERNQNGFGSTGR